VIAGLLLGAVSWYSWREMSSNWFASFSVNLANFARPALDGILLGIFLKLVDRK